MLGDLAELVRRQTAWLMQHRLPSADLSDIVQLSTETNSVQARTLEAKPGRSGDCILADPDRVAPGVGILGFESPSQHLDTLEKQLLDPLGLLLDLALEMLLVEPVLENQCAFLQGPGDPRL